MRELALAALVLLGQAELLGAAEPGPGAHVRVSARDPRYFELSDGKAWVPVGLNLIAPDRADEAAGLAQMDEWLGALSSNGGNYARVWLSSPFWDPESRASGEYEEQKARRIDALLALARRHGIRLKLTLEHFREMSDSPRQPWANKPLHLRARGGAAAGVPDFFTGEESRRRFRSKLQWLAKRYGDDPVVYGWELWNEVNAVQAGPEHFMPWTRDMLAELRRLFPATLALQSLGSFDTDGVRELYREHSRLPGNDVAQVHRYLDLGAALEVCHGPVDVLAADAVRELLRFEPERPVLLAESGAVEPNHAGPFALYAKDEAGMLLHDVLFAPFFAGAAGPGQAWHWNVYVDRNRLWFHFARFAAAIDGFDPLAEAPRVRFTDDGRLRVYALEGRRTLLAWCRDGANTWRTELAAGQRPLALEGRQLDLARLARGRVPGRVRFLDPWSRDPSWTDGSAQGALVPLPSFSRSLVVRVELP